MNHFQDPRMTKKQIKKINNLTISEVKSLIAEKTSDIENISGKKFADYKLQKIGHLKYLLNSQIPSIVVNVQIPHKGRIGLSFKKLEDEVLL